jgi:hypothetical protein
VKVYVSGNLIETIPVTSSQIRIIGSQVEIQTSASFPANTLITVTLDSCFKDEFGTSTSSIGYGDWLFRTADYAKIIGFSPQVNGVIKSNITRFELTYSRPIVEDGLSNIVLFENGQPKETIVNSDSKIEISGNVLAINSSVKFNSNSRIAILVPGTMYKDSFGLALPKVDTIQWHFNMEKTSSINNVFGDENFTVYPNPSNGKFRLNTSVPIESVLIYDATGRSIDFEMIGSVSESYSIQIDALKSGLYFIVLNNQYKQWVSIEKE